MKLLKRNADKIYYFYEDDAVDIVYLGYGIFKIKEPGIDEYLTLNNEYWEVD